MRVLLTLCLALSVAFAAGAASAQDGDRVRRMELATEYVQLSMGENLPKMIEQMIEEELAASPDMPEAERAWMRANMPGLTLTFVEDVADQLTPIYAAEFSVAELEALVDFYMTPLGRSIATKQFDIGTRSEEIMAGALMRFLDRMLAKYCQEFDCGDVPVVVPSGK